MLIQGSLGDYDKSHEMVMKKGMKQENARPLKDIAKMKKEEIYQEYLALG